MLNLSHQYLIDWSTTISMFVVILVFLFLFEPRYPTKTYLKSLIPFLVCWFGMNISILLIGGIEVLGKYTFFTCTLTSLAYFLIVAKDRGGRFFFTFCLVDTILLWIMMVTGLLDYAVGSEGIVNFISRMIAFALLLPTAWFWARKRYLRLLHTVSSGWWLFTAMTGIFYIALTIMAGVPTNLRLRPEDIPAAVLVLILLPLTYMTIFRVILQQHALMESAQRQKTLEMQATSIEQRAMEFRQMQERMRIERHDLRHRFQTLYTMLENGQTGDAIQYIESVQNTLSESKMEHYCSNPILDAVLVTYFRQAKTLGIRVVAQLAIPDELPVPASDLSTVFANALENMILAVKDLPANQRVIYCKCIIQPRMMLEFANPYGGSLQFSADGLPVSDTDSHGIGTRSIKAFAEKYNAICSFREEDGLFKLQLAL